MAEIEIGILCRQALSKPLPDFNSFQKQVAYGQFDVILSPLKSIGNLLPAMPELNLQDSRLYPVFLWILTRWNTSREACGTKPISPLKLQILPWHADTLHGWREQGFLNEIAPTLFRLLYTCGLRPKEGRESLTENINLETGEILITHTKRNK